MNSDVLTDLNYSDFFNKHIELGSLFSVSAFTRIQNVEYGVLLENEGVLSDFQEKPHIEYLVSMGIYAVSKEILKYIPENTFWGFDDLMRDLLNRQKRVNVLRHEGYWLDIGRPDDYKAATDEFERRKEIYLK